MGSIWPDNDWHGELARRGVTERVAALEARVAEREAAGAEVYPPASRRLAALDLTPPERTRVVIFGQDPYHAPGQAMGLAFSVPREVTVPPSLGNIARELERDLGIPHPGHGDLTDWAHAGVLLLNTALSVERGAPGSHQRWGWECVAHAVIDTLIERNEPCVFLLWGRHAERLGERIPRDREALTVLVTSHPSPLGARHGFRGCAHFSRANEHLTARGVAPIRWERRP